jgi:hypothetical protein
MKLADIPVPHEMRKLPRDERGFPIFAIALIDESGKAHFAINDHRKVVQIAIEHRCGLCGRRLVKGEQWFIGGILSAFHERGAYIDPPMHEACARYALLACPHLANARYGGLDMDKVAQRAAEASPSYEMAFADNTMIAGRPVCFVLARATACTFDLEATQVVFHPKRPYPHFECWRDREMLPRDEAKQLIEDVLAMKVASTR